MMPHDKPNIILLQDDQHRWNALGCVNPLVKTPALDRLAADGVRYEQAVCQAPACVPSRYSLMLGLYPSQIGVRRNGQWLSDERMPLPTPAEHLRNAGYQTTGFGKTHWSAPGCSTRGFETRAIGQSRERHPHLVERGATMMSDVNASLGKGPMLLQVDFGFGDSVVPSPVSRELPPIISVPPVTFAVYPRERRVGRKSGTKK